jgi:hemolysin activation/secretion protein
MPARVSAAAIVSTLIASSSAQAVTAQSQAGTAAAGAQPPAAGQTLQHKPKPAPPQLFDIDEYRIEGADKLQQIEVEEAVYPFLGPKRSADDVEKARAALEQRYHDKGFQAVSVTIPAQNPQNGVVVLKVAENPVGRVRVKGSRYFDTAAIKKKATSLAEGTVPNFNEVTKDIVALNQWPDRRITPALRAGETPGTVDVDLNVEDKLPVHGSVELNNRQAPYTAPLRLSASFTYDNLWQLGHSLNFSYQVAPQDPANAEIFSGSYLARLPDNDFVSALLYGVQSNSNVATVGGTNVIGPGHIIGARGVFTLPPLENLFHSVSIGADYKYFAEQVENGTALAFSAPIGYVPGVATYNATWQTGGSLTLLAAGVTFGLRGIGSNQAAYEVRRDGAQGNFVHFNVDVSNTRELPDGFQLFTRMQGQLASQPLVSSEQFSAGGLDTVRGYLESEVLGDTGAAGTLELRSPNIAPVLQSSLRDDSGAAPKFNYFNEWRIFAYLDGASVMVLQPLPEQQSAFDLWSYGVGTRFIMADHLNGMVVLTVPMITQAFTRAGERRVFFRIWGEF